MSSEGGCWLCCLLALLCLPLLALTCTAWQAAGPLPAASCCSASPALTLPAGTFLPVRPQHSSPNGCLPETRIKALALDTLRGLAHLHARRVCCRDVKPENVMTRERGGQAVLVDLGMAVKTNAQGVLSANCGMAGSVLQMAPEVMQVTQPAAAGTAAPGKGQGKQRAPLTRITVKSDVYSLGKTLVGCAVRGGVKVDRVRSAPLREFLQRLMAERPEERLSAEEALLHPFLAAQ